MQQPCDAGKVGVHARVHHMQSHTVQAREHVHGRASRQIVEHHLVGDGAGVGADAFGGDAVVTGEDVGGFLQRRGQVLAADRDQLRGEILEPAEAAERLGEGVGGGRERRYARIRPVGECGSSHRLLHGRGLGISMDDGRSSS